jgi:hypothetical protein
MTASKDSERPASNLPEGCKTALNGRSTQMIELVLSELLHDLEEERMVLQKIPNPTYCL